MLFISLVAEVSAQEQAPAAAPATAKATGDVTQVAPGHLTLRTATGDVQVTLPDGARLLRVPPGAKDLKSAVAIAVTDIVPGDRAVVLGHLAADQQTIEATRVLVLTQSDLASLHAAEVREWQTRGIEGIVKSIDADKHGNHHRRAQSSAYARQSDPSGDGDRDSAKPYSCVTRRIPSSSPMPSPARCRELKLATNCARLEPKSDDGSHYAADKVIFGTFHNIGATVISVDTQAKTLTVKNLATNKPVVVHVNADCKMHQLPDFVAQMIARLNSGGAAGPPAGGGSRGRSSGRRPRWRGWNAPRRNEQSEPGAGANARHHFERS